MKKFEEYLKDMHAENYHGVDDDMPDSFETWLADLDTDEIINYANKWGVTLLNFSIAEFEKLGKILKQ